MPRGDSSTAAMVPTRFSTLFACKPLGKSRREEGSRGPSWVTGPGRAALPLGLEGRRREPVGMSQHSSYDSVFPRRERMLRTALRPVQARRARNRAGLYVLAARVAPVGKSPSANPAEVKKSRIFPHHEAGGYPTPCGKMQGGRQLTPAQRRLALLCLSPRHRAGNVIKSPAPGKPSQPAPKMRRGARCSLSHTTLFWLKESIFPKSHHSQRTELKRKKLENKGIFHPPGRKGELG